MSEQGEFESGMSFNEGYRAGKKEMEELIKRKDEALVLANKRLSDEDFTLMNIALDLQEAAALTPESVREAIQVREELVARKDSALRELIYVKELKDSVGKTPEYERRKPIAWENARSVLALTPETMKK